MPQTWSKTYSCSQPNGSASYAIHRDSSPGCSQFFATRCTGVLDGAHANRSPTSQHPSMTSCSLQPPPLPKPSMMQSTVPNLPSLCEVQPRGSMPVTNSCLNSVFAKGSPATISQMHSASQLSKATASSIACASEPNAALVRTVWLDVAEKTATNWTAFLKDGRAISPCYFASVCRDISTPAISANVLADVLPRWPSLGQHQRSLLQSGFVHRSSSGLPSCTQMHQAGTAHRPRNLQPIWRHRLHLLAATLELRPPLALQTR